MGKAVVSESDILGSSPTAATFFYFVFCFALSSAFAEVPHLRKAEVFWAIKTSAFL